MSKNLSLTDEEVHTLFFLLSSIMSDYAAGGFIGQWSGHDHINEIDNLKRKLKKLVDEDIYNKRYH